MTKDSTEYHLIGKFYGDRRAERSGVLLIDHINEGLHILGLINASPAVKRAYCLHPLFQTDEVLVNEGVAALQTSSLSPYVVMLVMEYRARANAWLSNKVKKDLTLIGEPSAGPLQDVKYMLIADKVQNRKDFELYHRDRHPRAVELARYFDVWLWTLGVSEMDYQRITASIGREK